ncbi:MAG: metallo-beta-lactamase [Gemmatimonadaceae bacterium]|nr:metallo-beta-lactamase [Gemmatimonadaceae bacterium]
MSGRLTKRRAWAVFGVVVGALLLVLVPKGLEGSRNGGQKPVDPFLIAGNLYYVGSNDITAFLLTGPEGHVLIGDGRERGAAMIMTSIAKLGFKITDVKVLLNSHPHFDHAGALAELQRASGAQVWISEPDADIVAAGGAGDASLGRFKFVSYFPMFRYPPPRIDHRFKDGTTIQLGPIQITAHITGGHTRGSTTWSFPVRDGNRQLLAVSPCDLSPPLGFSPGDPPRVRAEFERSFRTLRRLPADIFLASHARQFGRWRKLQERTKAANPVDPFIDRAGYVTFVNRWEEIANAWLVDHGQSPLKGV